jgi:hypothetical protein
MQKRCNNAMVAYSKTMPWWRSIHPKQQRWQSIRQRHGDQVSAKLQRGNAFARDSTDGQASAGEEANNDSGKASAMEARRRQSRLLQEKPLRVEYGHIQSQ